VSHKNTHSLLFCLIFSHPTTQDPNFFKAFVGQKWAQPSLKHLVQLMRQLYNNPAEGVRRGKAARKHIEAHFTPEVGFTRFEFGFEPPGLRL
jgi:hypothetical protein